MSKLTRQTAKTDEEQEELVSSLLKNRRMTQKANGELKENKTMSKTLRGILPHHHQMTKDQNQSKEVMAREEIKGI
jgi:hypothetical protein